MAYSAFLSYSHSADSTLAPALQSALHRFARPWYKLRALHIFRDQTNLAVNPALWASICEALNQSEFFILLASPEAAASPWVGREAEYWIGKNGLSHFLIVLTGGTLEWDRSTGSFSPERTNALPPGLLGSFPEEPLYLDLRWARGAARLRLGEPRFHEAVLQLASTLRNQPKDELDGADVRYQRHARLSAAAGVIAVLLAGWIALHQTHKSLTVSTLNLADSLAARSTKVLADSPDRAREAAILAIESDRLSPSFESNQALRAAVSLLPAAAQSYPPDESNPEMRVRDLAFSPDGARLAVERDDGSTQIIDTVNHKALGYFSPDDEPAAHIEVPGDSEASSDNTSAVSASFNAASSLIASGSRDGLLHVWALPGAREMLRINLRSPVSQIAFHPKTNQLVTASDDGHVRVFDSDRAAIVADFQCSGKASSASFNPAGDILAALCDGAVSLYDPAHNKLLREMPAGEAAFNLAFSKDGQRLAAAAGNFAFVWDVASGRQLLKASHATTGELTTQQWISDVAISPDGKLLAYASNGDKLARVWDIETGRVVLELKHDSAVAAVAFNGDGTRIGTGSYDGTARLWEIPSGREIERTSHGGGSEKVVFSPSGDRFAAGGVDGSVSVSESRQAGRSASFDLPDEARSVAFSPDGRRFAIGTVSVHHWPLVKVAEMGGNILREIEIHGAPVVDKLYFLDPNQVVARWSDKLFLVDIDRSAATLLPDIPGDKRIEPLGNVFAIQRDGATRLYSLPTLLQIASPDGPSSGLLGSAGGGKLLAFEAAKPPHDFFIDVWNLSTKARVSHIALPAELNHLVFNPSGAILYTAEGENLQAWDIPSGKQRLTIRASGDIDAIVPDPSSLSFGTITHGQITLWDSTGGAHLAQLPDRGYIRSAAFSPDGHSLLTGYVERSASLWLWQSKDLRDQACTRITSNLTREEWTRWIPEQEYRATCPNLPPAK